jgi:UDP-2,3-diacylglucosamine pyrophosphatase LpxH
MSVDTTRRKTHEALDRALRNARRLDGFKPKRDRVVVFSDIHKGDGRTESDDFRHNVHVYCFALQHYETRRYSLILNGDCEDCWETDPEDIVRAYGNTAFAAERGFNARNRYFRTFGNHDNDWKDPSKVERHLVPVLGPVPIAPAILLGGRILIVHGHQGDPQADRGANWSRWTVRNVWEPMQRRGLTDRIWPMLQLLGFEDFGPAAQNNFVRRERDQLLYEWAKANRLLLIAGHTHRGMFGSFSKIDLIRAKRERLKAWLNRAVSGKERLLLSMSIDHIDRLIRESVEELKKDKIRNRLEENPVPCYFNDGCCVHANGITGIEIDRGTIRLVKWELSDDFFEDDKDEQDLSAALQRRVLQSADLEEILAKIRTA